MQACFAFYATLMIIKKIISGLLLFALFSCADDSEPSPTPEETEQDIKKYHNQSVGKSAADLLVDTAYNSLRIDLVYVEGYEPTSSTLNNLKTFLESRLNKPQGITIAKTAISSPGLAPYSIADIQQVESNFRSLYNQDKSLAVFVFIADGSYADNENVLGVAYKNTSTALFGSKIKRYSGGVGQPSRTLLETTVLHHEFGHIMGLVNTGAPLQTDHQDEAHGRHCDVESCLMYWSVETGDVVSNLVGASQPPSLDAQCLADLRALGGK